jgi:chloramphenicol-sensitive protein RarD
VSLLGVVIFRERLSIYKKTALILAGIGVLVIIVHFGEAPVVALTLAVTFACYAALKKTFKVEAILSLLYETALLVPLSLAVIIWQEVRGQGALAQGAPWQIGLLLLAGVLTAVPLGLFASAAKRIPLVTLGLTEYIAPSITLVIGIFMFREPFDLFQLIAFIIIWIGLGFFTVGEIKETGQTKG